MIRLASDQIFPWLSRREVWTGMLSENGACVLNTIAAALGHEMSGRHLRALVCLAQATRPLQLRELAAETGFFRSVTTRMVIALERAGLAARAPHPHDRRNVLISLTPEGRRLVASLAASIGEPKAAASQ